MVQKLPTKQQTAQVVEFIGKWRGVYGDNSNQYPIGVLANYLEKDSKLALACDMRLLASLQLLNDYHHDNADIQDYVRSNFASITGSWEETLLGFMQYLP